MARETPGEGASTASWTGTELHDLIAELYPICRSMTGDGVRETLRRIGERIPLRVTDVPTGTRVLDWTVPKEWNIRDAWIRTSSGERIVDFRDSNLHVVAYSKPVRKTMTLEALRPHLHSIPEHPDRIPYRRAYFKDGWGFCLPHRTLEALPDGEYEVRIDSTLEAGHLTYGECYLPGETDDEILISAHVCHPSLCNDNLSGVALATCVADILQAWRRRYSYRILFAPATIGAIAWLAKNPDAAGRVAHGLVLSCVGDPGSMTYKRSRRGAAHVDRAVEHTLEASGDAFEARDFSPWGYDERQYCSPGFDLPVGCLMRTPNGEFPEYHTSADDLDLVRPDALADSATKCLAALRVLERDGRYRNLSPHGEPQLGRRGVYEGWEAQEQSEAERMALFWVLNLSDGGHSLLDIARRAGLPFDEVRSAADRLLEVDLLEAL